MEDIHSTLVIDQGTFATRAFLMDGSGRVRASAFCPIRLLRHDDSCVEQDADEIRASVQRVVREVLKGIEARQANICRAGLATQRSSVVAWDRHTGEPLGPVLSWQDRRAATWLKGFDSHKEEIKRLTGLPLSPHYGASKLRWLLDHLHRVSRAYQDGTLALGPLASFLLFHLLGGSPLLVDHANASRTQLWNLQARDWDPWLLELFGVPGPILPSSKPICHPYGRLKETDIPLTAVNGDQTAAIYSLGHPQGNTAIINIGTGAFILLPTGGKPFHHPTLLSGLSLSTEEHGEYTLEGTVNGAGAALEWASGQWHLSDMTKNLSDWLKHEGEPPLFLNTIGGLGSPWWRPGPEPTLVGDGEQWQRGIAVAESILFLLRKNLDTMLEAGFPIEQIRVSGGLARIDGLCQRLADLARMSVHRPPETEATAQGIAWLAAGQPSNWPEPEQGALFSPRENTLLQERYRRFCRLIEAECS